MSEEKTKKPKGKSVEIKLREDFEPNNEEIKKAQDMARSVSPLLLELFEAKKKPDKEKK